MDRRLTVQGEIFFTKICSDLRTLKEIGSLITETPDAFTTACLAAKHSASFSVVIIAVVWDQVLLHSPGWLQTSSHPLPQSPLLTWLVV